MRARSSQSLMRPRSPRTRSLGFADHVRPPGPRLPGDPGQDDLEVLLDRDQRAAELVRDHGDEVFLQRFFLPPQRLRFEDEPPPFQGPAQDDPQFLGRERLGEEIEGPGLHGFHGRVDGRVAGDDDGHDAGIDAPELAAGPRTR